MTDRDSFIRAATKMLGHLTREKSRYDREDTAAKRHEEALAIQAAATAVANAACVIAEATRDYPAAQHYHTHNHPPQPRDPKDPTLTRELAR